MDRTTAPFPDRATYGLLGSNAITLVCALWQGWPLLLLLWPYWLQSVIIGYFARRRILALERFSTEGFTSNGVQPPPTAKTKRETANFFAFHYGAFHAAYLFFLVVFATVVEPGGFGALDGLVGAALAVPFAMSHAESHREHVEADLSGTRNIGKLMFVPYARVVPMHLAIVLGGGLLAGGHGAWALTLFVGLKTLGDVGMHLAEHRWLQS